MSFDILHFTSLLLNLPIDSWFYVQRMKAKLENRKKKQKLVLLSLQESKAQHMHVKTEIKSHAFFFESLNLLV